MESNNGHCQVDLIFSSDSPPSDPKNHPVLIVGQAVNLNKIEYSQVQHKLEPRVSQEVFMRGRNGLHPRTGDSVISLYLNNVTIASLPARCSRHNAPSRSHSLASVVKNVSTGRSETIIIVCPYNDALASASAVARSYPLFSMKSPKSRNNVEVRVEFILVDFDGKQLDYEVLQSVADGVRMTACIVDKPCNMMGVSHFLQEIEAVSKEYNLEMSVFRGEQLKEMGLGGIYGVGKASNDQPALAVLTYKSKIFKPETTVAWVGKGIVYDTGGLSLKTKTMMPGMKRDCGGAAAILGAMCVAAKFGSSACIHAVFCLAENSVGSNATRPDDIHVLYSGRSVEINNTDAEGRLVLADGVVYAARNLNAEVIIDMATLTGAQGIATGKYHGGLLTNSATWERDAVSISLVSGDLLFPLVYSPELHFSEFNSFVADMKNSVADRGNAQSSCAGLFILSHLGFDTSCEWLHIDMASPVHLGERATGYGVALLTLLVAKYSNNDMLRSLVGASE